MRHHEPVYRDDTNALWGITRHRDIQDVEARAAAFVSGQGYRSFHSPEDRWPDIKGWAERLMQYDRITVDPEAALGMLSAISEFAANLGPMVDERRGCPVDDLVSVWANADPRRIPTAVDELVRWVTPLHNFFRTATEDTAVGDQAIAAGDRVVLLYASGNRDEDVFVDTPSIFAPMVASFTLGFASRSS